MTAFSAQQPVPGCWTCATCGAITAARVIVYNETLRQQLLPIPPVAPACATCGSKLAFLAPTALPAVRVIVLTGTCASGKKTVAERLMANHGFMAIDGNSVMHLLTLRSGGKRCAFNGHDVFAEITREIEMLASLGRDIVVSHVITPEDLPRYRAFFLQRKLAHRFFLIQPEVAAAIARSKTRACFGRVTDEYWIRHFDDALRELREGDHTDLSIINNTHESADETAVSILRRFEEDVVHA